jgi:hypothetical protein
MADLANKWSKIYSDEEIIESIGFILLTNVLKNLLARLELLDPLFSNTFNLSTKPILFKPKN